MELDLSIPSKIRLCRVGTVLFLRLPLPPSFRIIAAYTRYCRNKSYIALEKFSVVELQCGTVTRDCVLCNRSNSRVE